MRISPFNAAGKRQTSFVSCDVMPDIEEDVDIEVKYVGLRPGEKLFEEKLMAEEGTKKTDNDLIHVGKPIEIDVDKFLAYLKEIYELAMNNDEEKTVECTKRIVTTFKRGN